MKLLVLLICLGYALANEKLLDELDRILAAKDESSSPDDTDPTVKKMMAELVTSLESEDPSQAESSLYEKLMRYDDRYMADDNKLDDTIDSDMVVKRGRRPPPKYGYCLDGRTEALGPNDKGCARALCYDEQVQGCNNKFEKEIKIADPRARDAAIKRRCRRNYYTMRTECPHTCGYCKARSPEKTCEKKYPRAPYGCCSVGGFPALKQGKTDCISCRDFYPHACKQFISNRFGVACSSNSYRIRTFLHFQCPLTCRFCKRGEY